MRGALAIILYVGAGSMWAAQRYPVTGLVLKIDQAHRTFVASCTAIPGYMDAMVMPISVRDGKALDALKPSTLVDFTLVVTNDDSYAENVRVHHYQSLETEPQQLRQLQLLAGLGHPDGATDELALGAAVPDFTLTDQAGHNIGLSQLAGKVLVSSFIYTRCPLPNYCFRLSNNLGRLQKRFADRMGRDLVLLSVTMDPVHDTPEVLAEYASTWKADARSWHFLTGPEPEVKKVCRRFGVNFWPDEGTLTHSLHTIVIDRQGKLAANFEGNEFTAEQLGDFVESVLGKRP
ncbi:MAG TPA: SCO family protein [Bryobacteraceae bacterium]|jgi:protein SCO1/2|nr:SCO family protein [Bryobacteraceae bacterium]